MQTTVIPHELTHMHPLCCCFFHPVSYAEDRTTEAKRRLRLKVTGFLSELQLHHVYLGNHTWRSGKNSNSEMGSAVCTNASQGVREATKGMLVLWAFLELGGPSELS